LILTHHLAIADHLFASILNLHNREGGLRFLHSAAESIQLLDTLEHDPSRDGMCNASDITANLSCFHLVITIHASPCHAPTSGMLTLIYCVANNYISFPAPHKLE